MIKLTEFGDLLTERASTTGIEVRSDSGLIANSFRGREPSDIGLPSQKLGFWLGAYPVIVASLVPTTTLSFEQQTKAMHAQVLIARSYVPVQHVVDMHLFLLFRGETLGDEQAAAIDKLERDEAICRKLVFIPSDPIGAAFDAFIDRTFLARPWGAQKPTTKGFQLDQPAALVQEILEKQGLSAAAAKAWVSIADSYQEGEPSSPQELVNALVAAMDVKS
ncbi:hypothetical protein ACC725_25670 [Rhizobium ruizarguesonis]|jgi:hypothetical protein